MYSVLLASVDFYQIIRRHIPEDSPVHSPRR
jgi:hypothetical protein